MAYSEKRNKAILCLLLVVLVACIIALAVLLWLQFAGSGKPAERPSQKAPTEKAAGTTEAKDWAGKYYYGGMPRIAATSDKVIVLTNQGYVVAYDEAKEDAVWVCYRLSKVRDFQAPRRPQGFAVDLRTTARVSQQDYTGSG